jgi:hypothetical protein
LGVVEEAAVLGVGVALSALGCNTSGAGGSDDLAFVSEGWLVIFYLNLLHYSILLNLR